MKEIENVLIQQFLFIQENGYLYESYKANPSKETKDKLEKNFNKYYTKIRIISYLNKVIHFESKKFDNRIRKLNERFQIILDKPCCHGHFNSSLSDSLIDDTTIRSFDEIPSECLEDYVENQLLHSLLKNLSDRQKEILYFSFIRNLKDTEIAKMLNISQQSVTKTKNKTLLKIRSDFK